MAKIYQNENALRINRKRQVKSIFLVWLGYFMMLYLGGVTVLAGGFMIAFLLTFYLIRRYEITSSGIKGEDKALDLVKELSDDYHVFSNLKVEFEEKESETDLIVIGKKGIFVIEVKNHNGTIIGDVQEKKWCQHKVGKRGGKYKAELYNPVKQVGTHVWRLSRVLKDENIYTWVQGMVYFVNPKVKVEVDSPSVPVLTVETPFVQYLDQLKVEKELEDHVIRKIISILKSKM